MGLGNIWVKASFDYAQLVLDDDRKTNRWREIFDIIEINEN